MWKKLGNLDLAISQKWPKFLGKMSKKTSKIAIQINGKTRLVLEFNFGSKKEHVEKIVLGNDKIKKTINNKSINKIIFVPEKILNIVL